MAVIVKYENGKPLYRSKEGPGTTEEDRLMAQELDKLIKKELNDLSKKMPIVNRKNILEAYLEFGNVMRKIYFNSGLVRKEEKIYFEENVKIHAKKKFLAKDRSINRRHIDYCFRLASYDKRKVMRMKWGEWTEIFDRNQESRFDEWFDLKTELEPSLLKREFIRNFTKVRTAILNNVETIDFNKNELYRCYEASWLIAKELYSFLTDKSSKEGYLDQILLKIKREKNNIGKIILGNINPEEFKNIILKN